MVEAAHRRQALVKVIFENCFLQDEHKEQLCRICGEVRADFVKTSTGYGDSGATDDDLQLMRRCSPPHVQVKAAGGVRTFDRLLAVRALGVTPRRRDGDARRSSTSAGRTWGCLRWGCTLQGLHPWLLTAAPSGLQRPFAVVSCSPEGAAVNSQGCNPWRVQPLRVPGREADQQGRHDTTCFYHSS